MSQRKSQGAEGEAAAVPSHLRFVGRADYFVSGVPQSNLKVADEPQIAAEVSPGKVDELLATGLYVAMTAEEYEAEAIRSSVGGLVSGPTDAPVEVIVHVGEEVL